MLQTTYRHAKILTVFLPRFSRFFGLLSSKILKIICLTCTWSKFVDTSFHPSQNPQQNTSRRGSTWCKTAQNVPGHRPYCQCCSSTCGTCTKYYPRDGTAIFTRFEDRCVKLKTPRGLELDTYMCNWLKLPVGQI